MADWEYNSICYHEKWEHFASRKITLDILILEIHEKGTHLRANTSKWRVLSNHSGMKCKLPYQFSDSTC